MSEESFTRSMNPWEVGPMLRNIEIHARRIRELVEVENDPRPEFAELIRGACDAIENYIHHERQRD